MGDTPTPQTSVANLTSVNFLVGVIVDAIGFVLQPEAELRGAAQWWARRFTEANRCTSSSIRLSRASDPQ